MKKPEQTVSVPTNATQERAPLLLVFGPLADRVADILRSRPSLTARIVFAPPEAIHAVAAFLYLAPEAAGSDAVISDLIEQSDPRELLRKALPDWPMRLYRAWGRAGSSVRDGSFYVRLDAVCRGPLGSAFIDGDLTETRLDSIVNEIGMALRDVGLTFPVFITVPKDGNALVSLATPQDPSDSDWSNASEIVCKVIEKWTGCNNLRGRALDCAVANAAPISAADIACAV